MTRLELLQIVIGKARENGFDFKRWYIACLRLPWENAHAAMEIVESQRRYYALLFHHEFAQAFWKEGEIMTIQLPTQTFERMMPDGTVKRVERKGAVRRKGRAGVWRYHLGQMAQQEEPLRYVRRFVNAEEEMEEAPSSNLKIEQETAVMAAARTAKAANKTLELARKKAERRKQMEEEVRARQEKELEKLLPIPESKSRRNPRLPGAR